MLIRNYCWIDWSENICIKMISLQKKTKNTKWKKWVSKDHSLYAFSVFMAVSNLQRSLATMHWSYSFRLLNFTFIWCCWSVLALKIRNSPVKRFVVCTIRILHRELCCILFSGLFMGPPGRKSCLILVPRIVVFPQR